MKLSHKLGLGIVALSLGSHAWASNESLSLGQSILIDPAIDAVVDDKAAAPLKQAKAGKVTKSGIRDAAAETLQADDVSVYAIPVSYTLPFSMMGGQEFINYRAKLPILSVDDPAGGSNTGLGDISIGADYLKLDKGRTMELGLGLVIPTGDADDALGNDSFDLSLSGTMRDMIDSKFGWKASMVYILKGEGTVRGNKIDYGNVLGFTGGGIFIVDKKLSFTTDLVYLMADGHKNKTFGVNSSLDADLIDIVPAGIYTYNQSIEIKGSLVVPVSESVSGGGNIDRDINFKLGVSSKF